VQAGRCNLTNSTKGHHVFRLRRRPSRRGRSAGAL